MPTRKLLVTLLVSVALVATACGDGDATDITVAAATVEGSLPVLAGAADAAVGAPIPTVSGFGFDGQPVGIEQNGQGKIVLFLAHWCSHCRAEVPVVRDWVAAGGLPEGVELIGVATAIDPGQPNYPPDEWLEEEEWEIPTVVDPDNSVAEAYGLSAFPFWVFVGSDGTVLGRTSGRIPTETLDSVVGELS
jgi:thiol-disulfide isomerase/thioredoxin